MKFIGIIPSRYNSTRLPGKPLVDIAGRSMIERVYSRASSVLETVVVATDDVRIYDHVKSFGGNAVMTSSDHRSGTDRCREAYVKIGSDADVVVNIQGDEPFIDPRQIEMLTECFEDESVEIATLARPFDSTLGAESLINPNTPKLVLDANNNAILFSRAVIPYVRNSVDWLNGTRFLTHIGLYAYKADVLAEITQLEQSPLELAESLEQLRWIENGYKIRVSITTLPTIGIDTPEDLERARKYAATANR